MSRKAQTDAKGFRPATETTVLSQLTPEYGLNENKNSLKFDAPTDHTIEFIERHYLKISEHEYSRNGSDPGLVFIFNQQNFKSEAYREGSRRDVNEIITCMSRLGYNINENNVFNDLTEKEIKGIIEKITTQDLTAVNGILVFFLTHGDNLNRLYVKDDYIFVQDIWTPFANCKTLANKPKIFIFQACKGDEISTVGYDQNRRKNNDLVSDFTFQENHLFVDMLAVYATTEGNVSFRDPRTGSWFIQELCKAFSAYGRRDDIISLIIRTTKCVSKVYYDVDNENFIKKQLPVFVSTLTKKFYLNRSKDRNIIINLLNDQDDLRKKVEKLEGLVQELIKNKH